MSRWADDTPEESAASLIIKLWLWTNVHWHITECRWSFPVHNNHGKGINTHVNCACECAGVCFCVYYSSQHLPADSHFPHPTTPRYNTHTHTHTSLLLHQGSSAFLLPCFLSVDTHLHSSYMTLFHRHVSSFQNNLLWLSNHIFWKRRCTSESLQDKKSDGVFISLPVWTIGCVLVDREDILEWKVFPPRGLFLSWQAHTHTHPLLTAGRFLLAVCLYTHSHLQTCRCTSLGQLVAGLWFLSTYIISYHIIFEPHIREFCLN